MEKKQKRATVRLDGSEWRKGSHSQLNVVVHSMVESVLLPPTQWRRGDGRCQILWVVDPRKRKGIYFVGALLQTWTYQRTYPERPFSPSWFFFACGLTLKGSSSSSGSNNTGCYQPDSFLQRERERSWFFAFHFHPLPPPSLIVQWSIHLQPRATWYSTVYRILYSPPYKRLERKKCGGGGKENFCSRAKRDPIFPSPFSISLSSRVRRSLLKVLVSVPIPTYLYTYVRTLYVLAHEKRGPTLPSRHPLSPSYALT